MKKNLGKWILIIAPLIAAFVLLFPTYQLSREESIKQDALDRAAKADNPTDSLVIMEKWQKDHKEDYKSAKEKALKLGLDLRGGMYVTLEVDVIKLIEESAQRETIDEVFTQVIEKTKEEAKTSDEATIDLFVKNFNEIARPKGKSLISYFDVANIREASEEKILENLRDNAAGAIDQAKEVITQRIDKYGVSEPNIQKQGNRRILLELPGVENETEMRDLLQTTARLEFNLVRNNEDIAKAFQKIDKLLAQQYKRRNAREEAKNELQEEIQPAPIPEPEPQVQDTLAERSDTTAVTGDTTMVADTAKADSAGVAQPDTSNPYEGLSDDEVRRQFAIDHQFTRLFVTYFVTNERLYQVDYVKPVPQGKYTFMIPKDSIDKFNAYLSRPEIKALIPYNLKVHIGAKPDKRVQRQQDIEVYDMYSLKRDPELTGEVITDAVATYDPSTNQPIVLMRMNSDGSDRWAKITGANIKKQIAIVLDGRVYSAPVVQNRITGGSSQITGMDDVEEARLLEIVLKAGALKAPVKIIEERLVGPSLGEDSIQSGITASLAAALLVVLFMAIYYAMGGLVADFAVLLNITLVVAVLSGFGGTLTLPGIAGLILTIGMAVDANVLIFERIREELAKGRSLRSAVDEGFSKALSAILDSNITTFITALILFYFGSGPIQGFALTLMIGIFGTLFTGILVSRAIIEISLSRGASSFSFGQPKNVKA